MSFSRGLAQSILAAVVLTLAIAAPVLISPSTRLFGWEIDGREPDPYTVIEQFRTGEVAPPYLQPATDLVGRALALLLNPVAALNVVVLVTFPLAAGAAYSLARYVGASHSGSLLAGLAYAFSPFHIAHAAIHPHIAQTQWFPLYVLALWLCVEDARPLRLAALAVTGALTALSNFYAGLILVVLTPPLLAGLCFAARPTPRRLRSLGLTVGLLASGAMLGATVVALKAPALIANPVRFAFPRRDLFLYSAKWWSYLVPAMGHAVLGDAARRFWMQHDPPVRFVEQQVFLGWSPLLLAVAAALASLQVWRRLPASAEDDRRRAKAVLFFAGLAAIALVCSLSPARQIGRFLFVRPSSLLYEWAPMFRCYARFGMIVQLAVAVLAGLGLTALTRSTSRVRRAVVVTLLGAWVIEYAPVPWRWRDVLPTHGHRWLARQEGPLHVLDCAPWSVAEYTLPSLLGHPLSFLAAGEECRPALAPALMARADATHLLVRRASPSGAAFAQRSEPLEGLVLVQDLDDSLIFARPAP